MGNIKSTEYKMADCKDTDSIFYYEEGRHAMTFSERVREIDYHFKNLLPSVENAGENLKGIARKAFSKITPKPLLEKVIDEEIKNLKEISFKLSGVKSKLMGCRNIFNGGSSKWKPVNFNDFNCIFDEILKLIESTEEYLGNSEFGEELNYLSSIKLKKSKNEEILNTSAVKDDLFEKIKLVLSKLKENNKYIRVIISNIEGIRISPGFSWQDTSELDDHLSQLEMRIDDVLEKYQSVEKSMLCILDLCKK